MRSFIFSGQWDRLSSRKHSKSAKGRAASLAPAVNCTIESLEQRRLLTVFTVANVNNSGNGSLNQAILDANANVNSGGPDEIDFSITGTSLHTISITSALPTITDPVIINGYSQSGSSANTHANGLADNAVLKIELSGGGVSSGDGLTINTSGCTIEGLAINNFKNDGIRILSIAGNTGNTIQGNFIGTNAAGTAAAGNGDTGVDDDAPGSNTIGGDTPAARNVISGNGAYGVDVISTDSTGGTIVEGNYIGTNAAGTAAIPNGSNGVDMVDMTSGTVGGTTAEARNVISGNIGSGVNLFSLSGVTVEGNYVGTNAAGTAAIGNSDTGVKVFDASNNFIGGTTVSTRNVISGNNMAGVDLIGASTTGNKVQGNYIGTDASGDNAIANAVGVLSAGSQTSTIGGLIAGAGNLIAFNTGDGVRITTDLSGTQISAKDAVQGNFIHDNGGLGINLVGGTEDANGVTADDANDADTGPNGLQNKPNLLSGMISGSLLILNGNFIAGTNNNYSVDAYASDSADPSGFGEGQRYLGHGTVGGVIGTTPIVDMEFDNPADVGGGTWITATLTDSDGNTSEFSNAIHVVNPLVVTNTNNDGDGSLRSAIDYVNANSNGTDPLTVSFDIPGNGPHTIALTAGLPDITKPIIIDGYSQDGASPNTNPNGQADNAKINIVIDGSNTGGADGIFLIADNSTIKGLSIVNFPFAPAVGSGLIVGEQQVNDVISGNFIGVLPDGTAAGNAEIGVEFGSHKITLGGPDKADRNVIAANGAYQVYVDGDNTTGDVIEGNYIGINPAGTKGLETDPKSVGIALSEVEAATIGGIGDEERNVISGNANAGIQVFDSSSLSFYNNLIGANAANTDDIANGIGIDVLSSDTLTIGGPGDGQRNIITGNTDDGVRVETFSNGTTPYGVAIDENSIYDNGGLGINLVGGDEDSFGTTDNDSLDVDPGNNDLLNWPALESVNTSDASSEIVGSLDTAASIGATIDFYASEDVDPSGHGEGQRFIGARHVTTDSNGHAGFDFTDLPPLQSGEYVTATATSDPVPPPIPVPIPPYPAETSEFSNALLVPLPVSVSIDDVSHNEGNSGTTNYTFTVTRTGDPDAEFTVDYHTTDGTASTADHDYQATSGTLTFQAGDLTQTFTVKVNGDTKVESNEIFSAVIDNFDGNSGSIDKFIGVGTIVNDDSAPHTPSLAINDVSHNEGNSGTTSYSFTVTRSGDTSGKSTVKYTTTDGSAKTSDHDYQSKSGTLSFKANETSKTITVLINGDTKIESDETFTVNLSNASSATISDGKGTGTIKNDDHAALPTLSINDVTQPEGNAGETAFVFTVTRSGDTSGKSTVNFSTQNGTATTDKNGYFPANGTVSFAAGQKTATIMIQVDAGTLPEDDQTFKVLLSNPSNATITDGTGVGTIQNDDTRISINDVKVTEGNSGTKKVTITVTLEKKTVNTVTVKYSTADGTAKAGSDYTAASGTLTFKPGQTSQTITLFIKEDKTKESDETFFVNLTDPKNADILDGQGKVTIQNDD